VIETTSTFFQQPTPTGDNAQHIITCNICRASYASLQAQQEPAQAFPRALELAFMSACHYCFRCRRPACPQCWDDVHGVCGACVEEAHLPFRTEVDPLADLAFPPPQRTQTSQQAEVLSMLVCVKPGRFQAEPKQLNFVSTDPINAMTVEPTNTQLKVTSAKLKIPPTPEQSTFTFPAISLEDDDEEPARPHRGVIRLIERQLTILVVLLLIIIIGLIVLAEFSQAANSQIAHLLHVDIRREIAYLLSLIHQIH
jgi:hypothetical protein